ncbi:MAG: NAD-dependent epimerase/dehydratase family protein [Bacillota bacterium]|jgi:nucleoside-diphosphate-sugar epimerase
MNSVLITGANGFIGSHVVRFFCNQTVRVGCLVREGSDLKNIDGLPVELRYGSLEDYDSLVRALHGFDFVIHIAGMARDWGKYQEFYQTNVVGSLNLLRACLANQIKDMIFTATNSVYGEENYHGLKDETSPHRPHYRYFADRIFPCQLNYYRETKAIAKEKAIEFAKAHDLNLTVLEPVWVYGEREFHTGFFEYLDTARQGIPFLPGSSHNRFHLVYAGDLARAYWLAFQKRLSGINCFIIGNQHADYMEKVYATFCEKAGLKKPRNLSKSISYPIGFLLELIAILIRSKEPLLLTRGRVNMFYDNIEYATHKAQLVLGFVNEYSLEQGIEKTVRWYQQQNLL